MIIFYFCCGNGCDIDMTVLMATTKIDKIPESDVEFESLK